MRLLKNQYFETGQDVGVPENIPFTSTDQISPISLLKQCPVYRETPMHKIDALAKQAGVGEIHLKDETDRMALGSFKALGAAYVIAHEAAATGKTESSKALEGRTYVTASAGNHGLSVAAGARVFGASSVIYLSETVPTAFADRLREKGAIVRIEGAEYEASMMAAAKAAHEEGFTLLSDSSWDGYFELPHRLMEGYLALAAETVSQLEQAPTHIFLQAGVGGLAGAMAGYFREVWGREPVITVVEPVVAPALQASIEQGRCAFADGPVSNMGRLDCKEPSLIALKELARDANYFLTISDELASDVTDRLAQTGIASTPSGVAGLAAVYAGDEIEPLGMNEQSRVLCIISEGAEA